MCGILGQFSNNGVNQSVFEESLHLLFHRGPDNQNVRIVDENLIFGHTRLSIIDLNDGSNQPMESEASILTFNGEIYNYIELKKQLEDEGVSFKTKGDAEVLQKAMDYWGKSAILKLNGMWAFSYYNKKENSLIVSRDRFGKKPLYYFKDDDQLIFSSEIKSIFHINQKKRVLNKGFVKSFFCFNYWPNHSDKTFYNDILQVMPGEILEIDLSADIDIKIDESNTIKNFISDSSDLQNLKSDIDNSVEIRLRSNVPVGIFLSGGIDSTIVASYANKHSNDIHWLTGNTGAGKDLEYSRVVAKDLSVDLEEISIDYDQNMIKRIKDMTKFFEIPMVLTGNSVAMNSLYENISKKGVKVVLDGTGGDEMFGGYFDSQAKHYINSLLNKFEIKKFTDFTFDAIKYNQYGIKHIARDTVSFLFYKFLNINVDIKTKIIKKVECFDKAYSPGGANSNLLLDEFMLHDMQYGRLQMWLRMNDMNSMMYSVESRSPLLDYRLLKYLSNDENFKFNQGFNKYLLRQAVPDDISGDVIWRRDKQGFRWVASKLLKENMSEIREKVLASKILESFFTIDELKGYFQGKLTATSESFVLRCYAVSLLEDAYDCEV
jgi:asparagine synthase (glutamine-hydrolysing)